MTHDHNDDPFRPTTSPLGANQRLFSTELNPADITLTLLLELAIPARGKLEHSAILLTPATKEEIAGYTHGLQMLRVMIDSSPDGGHEHEHSYPSFTDYVVSQRLRADKHEWGRQKQNLLLRRFEAINREWSKRITNQIVWTLDGTFDRLGVVLESEDIMWAQRTAKLFNDESEKAESFHAKSFESILNAMPDDPADDD